MKLSLKIPIAILIAAAVITVAIKVAHADELGATTLLEIQP